MPGLLRSALWLVTIAAFGAGCGRGTARQHESPGTTHVFRSHLPAAWPALPTSGYISGRVATAADVSAGKAVFSECVGVVGRPLHVAIPQYALWRDPATDSIRPVVVVEAELFDGDSMFGLRRIPGRGDAMAKAADLELLGPMPPAAAASLPQRP